MISVEINELMNWQNTKRELRKANFGFEKSKNRLSSGKNYWALGEGSRWEMELE